MLIGHHKTGALAAGAGSPFFFLSETRGKAAGCRGAPRPASWSLSSEISRVRTCCPTHCFLDMCMCTNTWNPSSPNVMRDLGSRSLINTRVYRQGVFSCCWLQKYGSSSGNHGELRRQPVAAPWHFVWGQSRHRPSETSFDFYHLKKLVTDYVYTSSASNHAQHCVLYM